MGRPPPPRCALQKGVLADQSSIPRVPGPVSPSQGFPSRLMRLRAKRLLLRRRRRRRKRRPRRKRNQRKKRRTKWEARRSSSFHFTRTVRTAGDRNPAGREPPFIRGQLWKTNSFQNLDGPSGKSSPEGFSLCAEHVRQLGGESPLHNLMEVK